MSGIPNMNEWEDSWKALHKKILRHERESGQKYAVQEWKDVQRSIKYHKDVYVFNRKEIDKAIAKTTRSEMRMWLKLYAKLMKGQEN